MLGKLVDAIQYALLTGRVDDLMAKGDAHEAQRLAMSVGAKFDQQTEWRILRMNVSRAVRDYPAAVAEARGIITRLSNSRRRKPQDRDYLLAYVKWQGDSSLSASEGGGDETIPAEFWVDWASVKLSDVSPILKRRFPLRPHPNWPKGP